MPYVTDVIVLYYFYLLENLFSVIKPNWNIFVLGNKIIRHWEPNAFGSMGGFLMFAELVF